MTSTMIPDSLPPLVRGLGHHPATGGCLMQVTNYIATGRWTDGPARSVHPLLQRAAILTNDSVCDDHRKKLWPFVPRLIGTFGHVVDDSLSDFIASELFFQVRNATCDHCLGLLERSTTDGCTCCHRCVRLIESFDRLITRFDHMVQRSRPRVMINWLEVQAHLAGDVGSWRSLANVIPCGMSHCTTCRSNFVVPTVAVADVENFLKQLKAVSVSIEQMNAAVKTTVAWSSPVGQTSSQVFVGIDPPTSSSVTVADVDMLVEAL